MFQSCSNFKGTMVQTKKNRRLSIPDIFLRLAMFLKFSILPFNMRSIPEFVHWYPSICSTASSLNLSTDMPQLVNQNRSICSPGSLNSFNGIPQFVHCMYIIMFISIYCQYVEFVYYNHMREKRKDIHEEIKGNRLIN